MIRDFRKSLTEGKDFVITWELVPGRGFAEKSIANVEAALSKAAEADFIHAVSITDNAGGTPALSPGIFGIQEMLKDNNSANVIVHFSCKDMNRNGLESHAMALSKCGLQNLLVISGDYPVSGFCGRPKPVFDLDSVTALCFLKQLNNGLEVKAGAKIKYLTPTDFYIGAAVSPFKWDEASLCMQYYKLEKKIKAGADYLITQLGYDARKFRELILYIRHHLHSSIPVLGSVYVLTAGAAEYMHRGLVPGCYMSKEMLTILKKEAGTPDKGKQAYLLRAARQVCLLKGLGYNGAHIEGLNINAKDIHTILTHAEDLQEHWQDYAEEFSFAPAKPFYFFSREKKQETGGFSVSASPAVNPQINKPERIFNVTFRIMYAFHKLFFVENTPGYKFFRSVCRIAQKKRLLYVLLTSFENTVKKMLFDCRCCDDCALFNLHYLCPESKCPKGMRNGPCGGSRPGGKCEVHKERDCLWVQVYKRAKNRKELGKLIPVIAPRNWELYETSSWINYFLKKDHSALNITDIKHKTNPAVDN